MYMVNYEMFAILVLLTAVICYRYGTLLYLALSYILIQGLLSAFFPQVLIPMFYGDAKIIEQNAISMASLGSLVFFLIIFLAVFGMKRVHLQWLLKALCFVSLFNCCLVMWNKYVVGTDPHGLLLTSTMDGMFIGMMIPFLWVWAQDLKHLWVRIFFRAFPIIAIFVTVSSIGIGACVLGLLLMYKDRIKVNKYLALLPIWIFILAVATNPHLFDDSKRIVAWVWTMKYWSINAKEAFGMGLGAYFPLCFKVQWATNHMNEGDALYTFLHNDWLQGLFEIGWIGMGLVLAVFIESLRRSFNRPVIFASVAVYGACAFLNFPIHNGISALLGMVILRLAMEKDIESVY